MALAILRAFLAGTYEGGRHDARLAKLTPSEGNP
jgi:ribose 5-phosphate isomerase RpiB